MDWWKQLLLELVRWGLPLIAVIIISNAVTRAQEGQESVVLCAETYAQAPQLWQTFLDRVPEFKEICGEYDFSGSGK